MLQNADKLSRPDVSANNTELPDDNVKHLESYKYVKHFGVPLTNCPNLLPIVSFWAMILPQIKTVLRNI